MRSRTLTSVVAASVCAATAFASSTGSASADSGSGVVLTVAKSGGQFTSVQAAVDAVPDN
jgi:pectin methylesterase-like acyl-CoA thioesterase